MRDLNLTEDLQNCKLSSTNLAPTTTSGVAFQTPFPPAQTLQSSRLTLNQTIESSSSAVPAASDNTSSTPFLSTPITVGISVSLTLSILLILFLIFGIPYLRKWTRLPALQRVIDEVERGIEMGKDTGHRSTSEVTESKENMVLESRVEIVVGEEESEMNVVDALDGWNATLARDDEEELEERGRKGMSLPRRVY